MRAIVGGLLLVCAVHALADLSPVRIVEKDDDIKQCSFVGQITGSNGLFQTKTANKILQAALKEAAQAGADTVIVRKSAHSGVLVDAYKCKGAAAAGP
jgi:hypothetical protein